MAILKGLLKGLLKVSAASGLGVVRIVGSDTNRVFGKTVFFCLLEFMFSNNYIYIKAGQINLDICVLVCMSLQQHLSVIP